MNGEVKQDGSTSDMIFKIPALVEHVSSIMRLEASLFIYFASSSRVFVENLEYGWASLGTVLLIPTVLVFASSYTLVKLRC